MKNGFPVYFNPISSFNCQIVTKLFVSCYRWITEFFTTPHRNNPQELQLCTTSDWLMKTSKFSVQQCFMGSGKTTILEGGYNFPTSYYVAYFAQHLLEQSFHMTPCYFLHSLSYLRSFLNRNLRQFSPSISPLKPVQCSFSCRSDSF